MSQFVYFLTNPGNESFLKQEILNKFSDHLIFSFSKPGICTFKNTKKVFPFQEIQSLPIIYARACGQSLGIRKKEMVFETIKQFIQDNLEPIYICQLHRDPNSTEEVLEFNEDIKKYSTSSSEEAKLFIIVIKLDDKDNYFVGVQAKDQFNSPPGRIFYELYKADAPSRAYHKLKEAFFLTKLNLKSQLSCAEFGCAPGGSTQYLLENGHKVTGVDPAKMDEVIQTHKSFKFVNRPMQDIERKHLPRQIDVLISDVNLTPQIVLTQFIRLFRNNPIPPIALMTLKTPTPSNLLEIENWSDLLKKIGYKKIQMVQLSGHRKEFLAIATA